MCSGERLQTYSQMCKCNSIDFTGTCACIYEGRGGSQGAVPDKVFQTLKKGTQLDEKNKIKPCKY